MAVVFSILDHLGQIPSGGDLPPDLLTRFRNSFGIGSIAEKVSQTPLNSAKTSAYN